MEAVTGTWLSIECGTEVGGDFVSIVKREKLGKAGSLELNDGGIQKRNAS